VDGLSISEKLIMYWTAVEPGMTNWPDSCEPGETDGPVMAIGRWGYTPVWITGVLVNLYSSCLAKYVTRHILLYSSYYQFLVTCDVVEY